MKKNKILVTVKGLEEAKKQLQEKLEKKEQLKNLLDSTREAGDLRENDAYTLALEDFKNNEEEIIRLQEIVSKAKIVKTNTKGKVDIGDTVVVKDNKGNKKEFTLVGANESDPLAGKISYESPLGKAILGLTKSSSFQFKTPKETLKYTVLDIKE